MVVVFFVHTVRTQNVVLRGRRATPDHTIYVVGQQWSWTFNYCTDGDARRRRTTRCSTSVGTTAGTPPTLVLPVDKTVEFKLHSPDVIHDFGVPAFLMKMDVIPGRRDNHFRSRRPSRAPTGASAPSCAASTTRGCSSTSRSSARPTTQTYLADAAGAGQRRRPAAARRHHAADPGRSRAPAPTEAAHSDRHHAARPPPVSAAAPRRSASRSSRSSPPPTTR